MTARPTTHRWLFLAALAVPLLAHAGTADDPDHGLARRYFRGLKSAPAATLMPTGKPMGNVLWIVVDATRADHLGLYGYGKPTTPFLDSFSKDAFVFLHHVTNAPWTRPSAATMLTGLFPSGHTVQTEESRLPDGMRTIGQDLKKLGYQTAGVVGNGNASSIAGLDRGFDTYVDTKSAWKHLPDAKEVYDEALKWTDEKRGKKKPWFLFVWALDPHDPYHAPPEYEKKWLPKGFTGEPRRHAHWEYKNNYPKAERDSMQAVYDASIRYWDDQTGEFIKAMEQRGLLENTTIIITADHGEGFGDHGYYLHAYHHYDEFVRVPLIIKSPAWQGHGYVFHTTQHVDLLPTLVAGVGGKARPGLPGADLTKLLQEPLDPGRLAVSEFNEFGIHRSSLVNQLFRVILQLPADEAEFSRHIPRKELLPSVNFEHPVLQVYDRRADPLDKKNLAKNAPPKAEQMATSLQSFMERAPAANREVDPKKLPKKALEELRSLGYVQ